MDTRQNIIEAATAEFAANGYMGTSVRMIAARAGVPHTLLSYHFNGKQGLWQATIVNVTSTFDNAVKAEMEKIERSDPATQLRVIIDTYIHFGARNTDFFLIFLHLATVPSEQLDWFVKEYLRPTMEKNAQLIRGAQKQGRFIEGDPYHLQYLFTGAATRIFLRRPEAEQIIGKSLIDEEFINQHAKLVLNLFLREPEKPA